MTPTTDPTRVIAIGDPGATQQQITTALGAQTEFKLVDMLTSDERLVREIGAAEPALILIDHVLGGQPTLDIIDDIALQFPRAAIIAMLPENDPVRIQQVIHAGARAFLVQPFTQINLLSTLRRVSELEARRTRTQSASAVRAPESSRPLHTVTVFSPRGGVGCTTVAANLAIAMYEATGQRVLLMDGKLFFGHLDVALNIRTSNTLADLIPHASMLDEGLIHDVVVEHSSGIHALLGPTNLQVSQGIRPDDLYAIFMGLQRHYDMIVIDGGSSLSENTVTLMDSADRILLVTTPDLAALHDVSRFVQISRTLAYAPDKILIVLNRDGLLGGVKSGDIEGALHHQVYAKIPDDGANALRSINRGIPLILRYPRSPASRAINELAISLVEMKTVELATPVSAPVMDRSKREALLASSQLG